MLVIGLEQPCNASLAEMFTGSFRAVSFLPECQYRQISKERNKDDGDAFVDALVDIDAPCITAKLQNHLLEMRYSVTYRC